MSPATLSLPLSKPVKRVRDLITEYQRALSEELRKELRLTVSASVQLHSQRDVTVPALWTKSNKPRFEWHPESVRHHHMSFTISSEDLKMYFD